MSPEVPRFPYPPERCESPSTKAECGQRSRAWKPPFKCGLTGSKSPLLASREVKEARSRLVDARETGEAEWRALADEFQAALQTISASVFALDAFYGVINEMVPPLSASEKDARRRSRAGRAVWVADAIGRASRMPNDVRKAMTKSVHMAFELRDGAVHPLHFAEPYATHPGMNLAVPSFYARYTRETSHGAVSWATEAIMWVVDRPKPSYKALNDYAIGASDLLHNVVDEHLTPTPGAKVGPRVPVSDDRAEAETGVAPG